MICHLMEVATSTEPRVYRMEIRPVRFNWALGGFIVNRGYGLIGLTLALFIFFLCIDLLVMFVQVLQ